jgi:8-oxo-dGTP diphosphatase
MGLPQGGPIISTEDDMLEVQFYDSVPEELLRFAVIISKTDGKWVFCKHRERDTLEVPEGHREPGEDIFETANRELREETGAINFTLRPVCVYSVKGKNSINKHDDDISYGMLFVSEVFSFGEIRSEIEKIVISEELPNNWTYPEIQPKLMAEAIRRGYL